jgi:hypothetical protein
MAERKPMSWLPVSWLPVSWLPFWAGVGLVGLAALLVGRSPLIVDIDVDRGLADCPWRVPISDPNLAPGREHDPRDPGYTDQENVFLVLRDHEHVALAEPVASVECWRPESGATDVAFGGFIHVWVHPWTSPSEDASPPGRLLPNGEPGGPHSADEVAIYRYALRMIDGFDLDRCAGSGRAYLDGWYREAYLGHAGLDLRRLGNAAHLTVLLEAGFGTDVQLLELRFPRTPGQPRRICQPVGPDTSASSLPLCPPGAESGWNWGPAPARRCPHLVARDQDAFE